MSQKPTKSPTKTCSERMGWLFGSPRAAFEPKTLPRDIDVIQMWMSCFDRTACESGKKQLSTDSKAEITNKIVEALTNHMKDLDTNMEMVLMEKRIIVTKVRRLIS